MILKDKFFQGKDLEREIAKLRREINDLKSQMDELLSGEAISDKTIDRIVDRVLPHISRGMLLDEREKKGAQSQFATTQSAVKYPPAITKSGFPDNLSDTQGDSYFRFINIKNNTADFEFCGNDFAKAKANKAELEQACEVIGAIADSQSIKNIENGTVFLQNGKWEVTKKAKIKFY